MRHNTLIITRNFYPSVGGVETYITEFIKCYLKRRKGHIYILCPIKAQLSNSIESNNTRLITPKTDLFFRNIDRDENTFLDLLQALLWYCFIFLKGIGLLLQGRTNISNIYGIGGTFAIFPSIVLAKLFNKKCFGHIHADFQFVQRNVLSQLFYRLMFNRLDKLFVNSKDVQVDLTSINVNKQKICVINNWADTEIFRLKDRKTCRDRLHLSLDKKILLFVGRLSEDKGILEVLNSIDNSKNREDLLFLIIGDGHLRPLVEARIKNNKNALYLGPKRDSELADYYNAADLLLWGAIETHYVSLIIMEALHCGLPVIAPITTTQDGKIGIKEFFVKQDTLPAKVGMLFDGDAESLVKAIDNCLNTRLDREEINKYALERYTEKNIDPVFLALY